MTLLVLPEPVCTDGASGDNASLAIPLYSPLDLCDHSRSGIATWSFTVTHAQSGYYALLGGCSAGRIPFHQPGFVLKVDDAEPSDESGLGLSGAFFWNPPMTGVPGPFPHTVCDWTWPSWYTTFIGFTPRPVPRQVGFWLSAGAHTISIQFTDWLWDSVQDDPPLCSTLWTAYLFQLTLLTGIACPGYVYATPENIALRLTVNPLAPTGLRLVVPSDKHLRLTING